MILRRLLLAALGAFLTACGSSDQAEPQAQATGLIGAEVEADAPETTAYEMAAPATDTLRQIQILIETGSLRRLARYADTHNRFRSNFGTEAHYDYWYLLRRTGAEPLDQLARILKEPHGQLKIGGKSWYIWPDFAAMDEYSRHPDQMDISTRTRLTDLIGESGVEAMRSGAAYPGVRTAISDEGEWIYWLFETGETQSEDTLQ